MNRIIKFRAWHKEKGKMWGVDYIDFKDNCRSVGLIDPEFKEGMRSDNSRDLILMQFTGLTDKNGKEIWEGDVVKETKKCWVDLEDEENGFREKTRVSVVVFRAHGFWIQDEDFGWEGENLWDWDLVEAIGNIYENPELLKP